MVHGGTCSCQRTGDRSGCRRVPYEDQTPDEVWELMQKRNYMLDYEGDDTGRIVALHIELLKPLKNPEKMRYKFTNGR